MKYYILTHMS